MPRTRRRTASRASSAARMPFTTTGKLVHDAISPRTSHVSESPKVARLCAASAEPAPVVNNPWPAASVKFARRRCGGSAKPLRSSHALPYARSVYSEDHSGIPCLFGTTDGLSRDGPVSEHLLESIAGPTRRRRRADASARVRTPPNFHAASPRRRFHLGRSPRCRVPRCLVASRS
jgi:hypothetical protein